MVAAACRCLNNLAWLDVPSKDVRHREVLRGIGGKPVTYVALASIVNERGLQFFPTYIYVKLVDK